MKIYTNVHRLTAPNPSPMTLTGTQTYLVGDRELIVIDPGPAIESHLSDIVDYVRGLGARVAKIVA